MGTVIFMDLSLGCLFVGCEGVNWFDVAKQGGCSIYVLASVALSGKNVESRR